ncbi:augmin complex subunit dgt5 [Culicoides brevitarsis]|uniref:augmin complex subunit dgt5 n=1 Tax=Culicoides brevitarsis TaxID=469753 RepID=UPI00307B3655
MNTESEFYAWIERMGIPDQFVPNKNNIKLLLSKNNLIFDDIMSRVRPRQDAIRIRDQLKVHHHARLKANKGQMPPQFKLYKEIKAANEECKKLEAGFAKTAKSFSERHAKVNEIEMDLMRAEEKADLANAKNILLQMKLEDLKNKLSKERAKQEDILKAFSPGSKPTKNECAIIKPFVIEKILRDCHAVLDEFYSRSLNETDSEAAQTQIWSSMRDLIDPVPRIVLWRALISCQDKLINEMRAITDEMKSRQASLKPKNKREAVEATLDYAITFINGKELLTKLKIKKELKPKVDALTSGNDEVLESLACCVDENLVGDLNNSDNQQLIEQFVLTMAKHMVLDADLKYIDKVSDDIREKHTKIQEQIDYQGTKMMTEETHRLYNQLESLVQDLEGEVTKIYQVKNKLENERKFNEDFVRNKFKLNTTVMGSTNVTSNFAPGTTTVMNLSMQYNNELELLEQLPIEKLKYQSPVFQSLVNSYPFILALNVDPHQVATLFSSSWSINELQDHVKKQAKFKNDVERLKKPLDVGFKPNTISETELTDRLNQNYEAITELIDKIAFYYGATKESIATCEELMDFVKQNPLKKLVPASILFNGRPYSDYENEFSMYYHSLINRQKE